MLKVYIIQGIAQSFKYDAKIFALAEEKIGISALKGEEYLKYDAMWHTAATEKFKGADADKVLTVADLDYPRLQRAILNGRKLQKASIKYSLGCANLQILKRCGNSTQMKYLYGKYA